MRIADAFVSGQLGKWPFLTCIFCLMILAFGPNSFGHDHHDHSHTHSKDHGHSHQVEPTAENLMKFIDLVTESFLRQDQLLLESVANSDLLARAVDESLQVYEASVGEECGCSTHKLHDHLQEKSPIIKKRLRRHLLTVSGFLSNFFWSEVSNFRRYGAFYAVILMIGEAIDHSVSFIPLCKVIGFIARGVSSQMKQLYLYFFGQFDQTYSFTDRTGLFFSRIVYRRKTLKQIQRIRENQLLKSKDFPKSLAKSKRVFWLDLKGSHTPIHFNSDQLIEGLEFMYHATLQQLRIRKSTNQISKQEYLKILWYFGAIGAQIDWFRALLRQSLYSNNQLSSSQLKLYELFLKTLREFSDEENKQVDLKDYTTTLLSKVKAMKSSSQTCQKTLSKVADKELVE